MYSHLFNVYKLPHTATEKENYNIILELVKTYLSESEIAVFKLGLSLRIYSARVEMFSQMAVNKNISMYECNNVVDIGGTYTCSLEEIDILVEQVSNLHFTFIFVILYYIIISDIILYSPYYLRFVSNFRILGKLLIPMTWIIDI